MGAVILINSLTITLGAFPELPGTLQLWVRWIDYACAWLFVLEAAIKIRKYGITDYWDRNWNRFDLTLVVLSSPILLMPVLNSRIFAVVLVLRLARLVRLFKILAFIPNREHLLTGIRRALRASVSVLLAMAFLLFFAALSGTMIFGTVAPDLFGDPFASAYSMFKIFTIEGWFDVPARLTAVNNTLWWSVFVKGYFIAFVVVGGMIGLSMLNAVFVDALVEDNNDAIEERLDRIERLLEEYRPRPSA